MKLETVIAEKDLALVDLPVVAIDTPLEEVLRLMKEAGRSGVLVLEGVHWLYKAGWIVVAKAQGGRTLADVGHCFRVFQTTASDVALETGVMSYDRILVDWRAPQRFADKRLFMLGDEAAKPGAIAGILTRDVSLANELSSGPTGYYCTNPLRPDDPHPYLPPPLPADRRCTRDGSPIVAAG